MNDNPQQPTMRTQGARPGSPSSRHKKKRRAPAKHVVRARQAALRKPGQVEVRRMRRRVLLGLYALLCVEVGAALLTSPALAIKKVRVGGLDALPSEERQATLNALALPRALNWFRVPLGRLRRDTNGLPWVRTASVERSYSGTLFAHVTPRQPFVALKVGTTWYEADVDGVPIRPARLSVAARLPRVVMQAARPVQCGIGTGDAALTASLKILQKTGQEFPTVIAKIIIDQSDNICLNMRDGVAFQLGQPDDVDAKIALVNSIYAREPNIGQTLAVVNLTCPSAPACTPRVAQALPSANGPLAPPANAAPQAGYPGSPVQN